MSFRSGFVSIIGRPNAGKSTLLNALVGEKLAIVTHKPQTTRNRIQGFLNAPAKKGIPAAQIIFVDTPGVHKPDSSLGKRMMNEVYDALANRDVVLLLVDVTQKFGPGDEFVLKLVKGDKPVFLILNKIDLIPKDKLLPLMAHYAALYSFQEVIPISAHKEDGLDLLVEKVIRVLPEGPRYFPKDQITDQPERFIVSEIIREKIFQCAGQEVPYGTAVVVERFEENASNKREKRGLIRIAAAIYCEREGQKAILIGRGGAMLKKIGTTARFEIEKLLGAKIFLELFVKVQPNWRQARAFVETLDWRNQLQDLAVKQANEPEDSNA